MDSDEKRDFPRMQINCELEYSLDGQSKLFIADAINLSATGILFETSQPLQVGDRIRIKVPSNAPTSIFRAVVEVLRIEPGDEPARFRVAGQVTEKLE